MNLQEYAAHRKDYGLRGASHVAVLKAIKAGRLVSPAVMQVGGRWTINPVIADSQWSANTSGRGAPKAVQDEPVPTTPPSTAAPAATTEPPRARPAPPPPPPPPPAMGGRINAETAKSIFQAKLLELQLGEKKGELVARDAEKARWLETARRLRDTMRRLPLLMVGDIGRIVGGLTQEQRAEILLLMERQIVTVLEEASARKS